MKRRRRWRSRAKGKRTEGVVDPDEDICGRAPLAMELVAVMNGLRSRQGVSQGGPSLAGSGRQLQWDPGQ